MKSASPQQNVFRPLLSVARGLVILTNRRMYDIRHPELVALRRSSLFIGFPCGEDPQPVCEDHAIVSLLYAVQAKAVNTRGIFLKRGGRGDLSHPTELIVRGFKKAQRCSV